MTENIFGFSTETSSGDFLPIVKYDARAGRFFRVERIDTGNGFENNPIDITNEFRAVFDFDNVEVGWIDFSAGSAPSFVLVPYGSKLPDKPGPSHKTGIRFMIKLAKDIGGEKPIRELANTSKAFLSGAEAVFKSYLAEREKNPGKLPVVRLAKTTPVKTGSGEKSSTNYHPTFEIIGWAPRGDLAPAPKAPGAAAAANGAARATGNGSAPATGSTRAEPPKRAEHNIADDFG